MRTAAISMIMTTIATLPATMIDITTSQIAAEYWNNFLDLAVDFFYNIYVRYRKRYLKPRILVYRSKSSCSFYYLTFLVGAGFRLVIPRARIAACQ